jgi:hypothetical protein
LYLETVRAKQNLLAYCIKRGFYKEQTNIKGHGNFFFKGHFARRIYQKGHIEKIG